MPSSTLCVGRTVWRWLALLVYLTSWKIKKVESHNCVHDAVVVPHVKRLQSYQIDNDLSRLGVPSRSLVEIPNINATTRAQPFRIKPVYQISDLDLGRQVFVRTRLIPAAIGYFSRLLKTRYPSPNPLKLTAPLCTASCGGDQCAMRMPNVCNEIAKIPVSLYEEHYTCRCSTGECQKEGGTGIPDADFILFVTASDINCADSTLAYAGHCIQGSPEQFRSRPIAGVVNFCLGTLEATDAFDDVWDRQLWVALHEITHVLAFSEALFDSYVGHQEMGVTATFQEGGVSGGVNKIITPKVLSTAREHFSCSDLDGAELEGSGARGDMGSGGTRGSHWSKRVFPGEYMVAALEPSQWVAISNLTLALFQDTGWYEVDFKMANYLQSGEGEGCDFATARCTSPETLPPALDQVYCSAAELSRAVAIPPSSLLYNPQQTTVTQTGLCSPDALNIATCTRCLDAASSQPSLCLEANCALKRGTQARCLSTQEQVDVSAGFGRYYGQFSRCLMTGDTVWANSKYQSIPNGAECFHVRCANSADGTPSLQVEVSGVWITCVDGQMVSLQQAGYDSGNIGPCPVAAEYCRHLNCPNDCNAKGQCMDGVCTCLPGYAGKDCSQVACSPILNPINCTRCDSSSGLCLAPDGTPQTASSWLNSTPLPGQQQQDQQQQLPQESGRQDQPQNQTPSNNADMVPPSPSSSSSTTSIPSVNSRPTIGKAGAVVNSAIRFAGARLLSLWNDPVLEQNVINNFVNSMSAGAQSVGYMGSCNVTIVSIGNGSIIVSSNAFFHDAKSYEQPDAFANLLRTNPKGVFKSQFFADLAPGGIATLSVSTQPAISAQNSDPPSNITLRWRKFLGLTLWQWAIIAAVLLFVVGLLWSIVKCLCRCLPRRQPPRQVMYQRNNIGPGSLQAMQLEGQRIPDSFTPVYAPPTYAPRGPTTHDPFTASTTTPTIGNGGSAHVPPSIPPTNGRHSDASPFLVSSSDTAPAGPPVYYPPPPTWASNYPNDDRGAPGPGAGPSS